MRSAILFRPVLFRPARLGIFAASLWFALASPVQAGRPRPSTPPPGRQTFASPQSNPIALSPDGKWLYVAQTSANRVQILDATLLRHEADVPVGIDPVGVAVRPDGLEVWVANHISDSVSVIDTDPTSPTYRTVIRTVQDFDPTTLATRFDEPVGIAFASNTKAYVTLSSRNQVAVVDATTYQVTGFLTITAQDPRALAVAGGRLYVAAFESSNQTQLSVCQVGNSPPQCTLSLDFNTLINFATNPNLPSDVKNIVVNPNLPDRDLFVFRTSDDTLVDVVSGVGTLLYGVAADASGRVFVAQTTARNDANGLDGQNLIDLDNRIFLNEVARVDCGGASCAAPVRFELEPLPPAQPAPGTQLATPYGIQVSSDGTTVVATAASSSRLFTLDPNTGAVLGRVDVGAIPRGVALRSDPNTGAPLRAYVLATLGNEVAAVDVSNPAAPVVTRTLALLGDPTPQAERLGRIAFNDASASTSGTFSCASCHPDGNPDQLLWRIGGACFFGACSGNDEPRTTMPIRGLRATLPLHWDGTLGDPFGGPNGAVGTGGSAPPTCDGADPHTCFVHLVDVSLAGVMCDQSDGCASGGNLSPTERDNMATFLASVAYPPARSRRPDDQPSATAKQGFSDFFMDHGSGLGVTEPSTCGDTTGGCHTLPLGNSTNSPIVGAFDAPTMRGMTDRFIQFSNAITSAEDALVLGAPGWDPAIGYDEFTVFSAAFMIFTPVYNVTADNIFQMFEEASTGFSGATGRQVTVSAATTSGGALTTTETLMSVLEAASQRGVVSLRGAGLRDTGSGLKPVKLLFQSDGLYHVVSGGSGTLSHAQLVSEAQSGQTLVTLTAELPENVGKPDYPQPLLAPDPNAPPSGPTGDPNLPVLAGGGGNPPAFTVGGMTVRDGSQILLDGQVVSGTLTCVGGSFAPFCTSERISIDLDAMPTNGVHLLQVQSPSGPLSNELPICVGAVSGCL